MTPLNRLLLAVTTAFFSTLTMAHDYQHAGLTLEHPWARATPPGVSIGGGFLTIHNSNAEDERLIGGSAAFAKDVQIHETKQEGDVMKMQHLPDGLLIPAGESVSLQPGSYHLMFMGLESPLVDGDRQTVTLIFENAGEMDVEFAIEKSSGMDHDMN